MNKGNIDPVGFRKREADRVARRDTTDLDIEMDSRVKEAVLQAAAEGRITCPAARGLADKLGVDPSVIGEACNKLGIRIKGCALGCF